jgi:hypothetical protein
MKYIQAFNNLNHAQSASEVEECFDKIARALLNYTVLEVANFQYKITEIEFYFQNSFFKDPFVHCDERQKSSNEWYFHRRGSGYKDGNYKGLDLTFGTNDSFGGILIRGMERTDNSSYSDGPSKVVDEILKQLGTVKVIDSAPKIESFPASSLDGILRLKEVDEEVLKLPIKSPRVGLPYNKQEQNLRTQYVAKDYRYHTAPLKTTRHRHTMLLALYQQGFDVKKAAHLIGIRDSEAAKYVFNFQRGQERDPASYVDQDLSVLDHCEFMGALNAFARKAS